MTDVAERVGEAAHDLNNLCASLMGFVALAQETVEPGSPLSTYLAEIDLAARGAAAVAERLSAVAAAAPATGARRNCARCAAAVRAPGRARDPHGSRVPRCQDD